MKKIYSLLLLVISSVSFGQVLTDSFNYADNSLLTDNGWALTGTSVVEPIDVGTANGLLYTGYNTTAGNAARLDNNGQDVNKAFAAPVTAGSTLYYSFLVKVTAASDGYFAHLITGTTTFFSKVFVRPSTTAGKINFGVANSNTATWGTSDFDLDTTYLIILKYEVSAAGAVSLWVETSGVPATEAAAGAPDATASGSGSATVSGVALRQFNAAQNITVDEIKVYTTWFGAAACALSLGAEATACDAVTLSIDTYEINIPFTGGNTGTYNLSSNAGTISGANPSTAAEGDIIISGVPEGTNVVLTVTGSCGFTKTIIAPECKPINTLPYSEPFPYTAGSALGTQQKWTNVNTGDDMLAVSGSLTHPGVTSTGNAISFTGVGKEAATPFTSTTSGTIYAAFLFSVTDMAGLTGATPETYFVGLTGTSNSDYKARLFLKKSGTQYQIGFDTTASTTNYDATLRNVGDVVYIVIGYDFTSNSLNAWINPVNGNVSTFGINPTAPITAIGGVTLRQDTDTTTPSITFDELRVVTSLAELGLTLGVAQNEITGLKMYPNPVSNGTLFIETAANAEKAIKVYDVLGKLVLNTTSSDNAVNVASLHAGVYIVNITEEGKTASKKLVIR
ncbi:T9SS type A sorting domain-containing protein [Flavobacterium sp. 25HG05S-40]|uniref:T9SS type A sorting domain-containing protein n=1 Tax=Flavobacterium sp. 25HG05S-40 TaxID=3458682 RepID=UPI0040444968